MSKRSALLLRMLSLLLMIPAALAIAVSAWMLHGIYFDEFFDPPVGLESGMWRNGGIGAVALLAGILLWRKTRPS